MKTTLILSGGGIKGAFQAGVIKQLEKNSVKFNSAYGTSVGALNASALAYNSADVLLKKWRSLEDRSDILKFNINMLLLRADGVYKTDPLRKNFINETITYEDPQFEVKVSRVNLVNGAIEYISNFDVSTVEFRDAVQDSSTIPLAMQPRDIYVDGGVRDVVPLSKAIEDGHKNLTIILTNPWTRNPWHLWNMKDAKKFLRFLYLTIRATDGIMNHEVLYNDLYAQLRHITADMSVKVYMPQKYLYDTLEVNPAKIEFAIQEGLQAKAVDIKDLF